MQKQYYSLSDAVKIIEKLSIDNDWSFEIELDETNNKYCLIKMFDEDNEFVGYYYY